MFGKDFIFLVEYHWPEIKESGIGLSYSDIGGDFIHNIYSTGEWGYAYMNLDGIYNGVGKVVFPSFRSQGVPATKEEALARILKDMDAFNKSTDCPEKHTVLNGHYPWQHYSAQLGFSAIGVETGEGIAASQFRIAITRGAAKQYDKPWFVDFSQWFGGYLLDYRDVTPDHIPQGAYIENSSKTGGHALNMEERTLMLAFMEGADVTIVEGGQYMCFYEDKKTLTPLGVLCKHMNEFTSEYKSKVGTAYVPFGIILDKYHGLGLCGKGKIFDYFAREEYDEYTYDMFNKYLFKGGLDGTCSEDDSSQLSNGKYGDCFDFFLPDVSAELIKKYSALIFTGNLKLDDEELQKYVDYVAEGGILVLNTVYAKMFEGKGITLPKTVSNGNYEEIKFGKGSFMVFGKGSEADVICDRKGKPETIDSGDWKLGGFESVMDELHKRFVPFDFDHECGYAITENDGTKYVMVYNNAGITKSVNVPEVIDNTKGFMLGIEYKGGKGITSVKDVYNGKDVKINGNKAFVYLAPGEMAILEFKAVK